ncbi:hypothetical protein [Streptomyces avermitilis]|uniref:hypothetical protein n=1 Tax=Streptomyces avermitilis TaxID=33903 RepID=UPI003718AEB6
MSNTTVAYAVCASLLICAASCCVYGPDTDTTPGTSAIRASALLIGCSTAADRTPPAPSSVFHTIVPLSPDDSEEPLLSRPSAVLDSVFGMVVLLV